MKSRVGNSLKNTILSLGSYLVVSILTIIVRTYFIKNLGQVYLGVNGIFIDILSILNLAELGIYSAVTYSLYKPISENNIDDIVALMRFYKKIYTIIGLFVFVAGIIILYFLKYFIKDIPNIDGFYLIGFLFIIETAITYFISYKRCILFASQKEYILSVIDAISFSICSIIRVAILVIFKSFVLYLICGIVITVIFNIILSIWVDKIYPFMKLKGSKPLSKNILSELKVNTKAMIFHKIGSVLVLNTDNLLISGLLGLSEVGSFSNYKLIMSSIKLLIMRIFNAITASYGNQVANESTEATYITFKRLFFFNYMISSFCCICLLNLVNPFISIWLGSDFLFSNLTVLVLVVNFYVTLMRNAIDTTKNVVGLYKQDKYVPLVEAFINLFSSIVFIKLFGIVGVFFGTLCSTLLTVFWVSPYIVYKHYFKTKLIEYFKLYFIYIFSTFFLFFITCIINNYIFSTVSITSLIGRLVVCIVSFFVYNLIFIKTREFKYFLSLFKDMIRSFHKKN